MTDTERTCETCAISRRNSSHAVMCYRPKTMASGKVLRPGPDGFSPPFETDVGAQESRADGDACGPDRRHWEVVT